MRHFVRRTRVCIHTIILAGGVLKPGFRWDALMANERVFRVVNECGITDSVLVWNQIVVLLTGMAGRVGFVAGAGERFRNRYFALGHSGYFRSADGALACLPKGG